MTVAKNFNIQSPANILRDPSRIRCDLFNSILNETSILDQKLIGNRLSHLAEISATQGKIEAKKEKSNLELMDDLGLLGALEDSEITSRNRKKFIKKTFRKRHGKEG